MEEKVWRGKLQGLIKVSNIFSNLSNVPGNVFVRNSRVLNSYTAVFRLAEAAARLDQTFTQVANTTKQWATVHHLATSVKTVTLQLCHVSITAWSVATQGILELRQLSATTAPATGNPAITPTQHHRLSGLAEAICLYLPSTQGTEANVNSPLSHIPFDVAAMGAVTGGNPMVVARNFVLYDAAQEGDEFFQPVLPAGALEGWAVTLRTVSNPAVRMTIVMKFTEE